MDPISKLRLELRNGKKILAYEPGHGYLKALLKELDIRWSSQVLVWSKTSLQGPHISPKKPRAIYFNDRAYVGWVNGGEFLEIASIDPIMGTKFFTIPNLEPTRPEITDEFRRCIGCHASRGMGSVPTLVARSVNADSQGYHILGGGAKAVNSKTPLERRWGGWYVTGTHGPQRHMGNTAAVGDDNGFTFDREAGANISSLKSKADIGEYLVPDSDIVALLVFDHQMHLQNEMTRAANAFKSGEAVAEASEPLLDALLCVGETAIASPIKGTGAFQAEFEKDGMRDKKGRSFRDLDLQTRLFRFRLSPMIDSPSFEGLAVEIRGQVYKRLLEILSGEDKSGKYDFLSATDRHAIQEILSDKKPEFRKLLNQAN